MGRRWRQGAFSLGMAMGLVGAPAAAWAQSEPPADPLVWSLLTLDDMPSGLSSQGIDEPPRFGIDDASFAASGGTRAVGQVWSREDMPPLIVFDFRMELPDAGAAAAYLDAAEPVLSEAEASGLAPVMFVEPVGEDGRYYFGVSESGDVTVQLHNYLFHVGPVAAKVFVGGVDIPEGLPEQLATAAAERIGASLADVPSASPGTVPSPVPRASPAASAPVGPLGELLAHVPSGVRASCDETDPQGSEIAVVVCTPPGGRSALYALYSNGIAVDGDFARITAGLATPRAETCAEGPYLGVYQASDDEILGQLACWTDANGASLLASDKRIPMLVYLLSGDDDLAALEEALPELAPIP